MPIFAAGKKDVSAELEAVRGGGLQSKNLVGMLAGIGGMVLGGNLFMEDSLTSATVVLLISSVFCLWKFGKGILEDLRGRVSFEKLKERARRDKELRDRLGVVNDIFDVMVKTAALDENAKAAAEKLSPEAQKQFDSIIRAYKPYSKRILEGLRNGGRTVDEVVDSVFSLKRL